MADILVTDTVLRAPMQVFAVRWVGHPIYWGCFIVGLLHVYWSAVMDDFGNLVKVDRHV